MLRRIVAAATGAVAAAALTAAVPTTPALAAPLPTPSIVIGCGPNWSDCQDGNYLGGVWLEGTTNRLTWWAKNTGSSTVTVTPTPGSGGCAQNAYPYPGSLTLSPGETEWFYTYVRDLCVGLGYGYANIYPASGRQRVYFDEVCELASRGAFA